jgi:CotH kinase protein/Secretion system C-terminal sorting domain/Lamin Tail Domain
MTRTFLTVCLYISLCRLVSAQGLTDSNLPIVIIETDYKIEIQDSPRVPASMKIISRGNGERNWVTDQNNPAYLHYNGRIDIEIRGSSSQFPEKKQYGFTTRKADNVSESNVSLLGMPKENDWILNSMAFDSALIRDYLTYNLSRNIGEYASRTTYCELIINDSYRGLYLLQEKIKADVNRVNVIKISKTDNSKPDLTGGYITKADKTTGGDPVAWTMPQWFGASVDYIHVLPKPEEVTLQQNNYIHSQFQSLETAAMNNNTSVTDGFPSIIDVPSFIDYIIINELASNADAYMYSTFFHKDRNGKLRAGPVWDNDLTYGNDLLLWGYDRSKTNIWQLSNGENDGSRFWKDLFDNAVFKCYLAKRWNDLIQPGQPLNLQVIESFIDQTVVSISEAVERNNALWGITGSLQDRISAIKSFLELRISWMTSNLGSFTECSNMPVPPLVISKIMYGPPSAGGNSEANDPEFIEITNTGDQYVVLNGVFFSGTGFVYQFPASSTIAPCSSVFLAGNIAAFKAKYGFSPFGQFTRDLPSGGENLTLVDGFGNIIDNVSYSDTLPWPDANGNGKYLKLPDLNLDNNISSSWIASSSRLFDDQNIPPDLVLQLYPNPVSKSLNIQNGSEIRSVSLYDIYGRLLMTMKLSGKTFEIDMNHYKQGVYILKVTDINKTYTRKLVKN